MTVGCIKERLHIIERLWRKHHNKKHVNILLQQLRDDIVFLLKVRVPKDIEERINQIDKEVNDNDYK